LIETVYSSVLTINSCKCSREPCDSNYYCNIIEVQVHESGIYTIFINGTTNMFGYAYENNYTLFDLTKNSLIKPIQPCEDRFKFTIYRYKNSTFILIITTVVEGMQGNFSVFINGSTSVDIKHIGMSILNRFFTGLYLIKFSLDDCESAIESNYSWAMNISAPTYHFSKYKLSSQSYEIVQINITKSGYYLFSIYLDIEQIKLVSHLYEHYVNLNDPNSSISDYNRFRCTLKLERFVTYLYSNITYLLLTIYGQNRPDLKEFPLMTVSGPDSISIKHIGICEIIYSLL